MLYSVTFKIFDKMLTVPDTIVLQASIGIAKLLMMALREEGSTEAQAYSKIWMVDSKGLIVKVIVNEIW